MYKKGPDDFRLHKPDKTEDTEERPAKPKKDVVRAKVTKKVTKSLKGLWMTKAFVIVVVVIVVIAIFITLLSGIVMLIRAYYPDDFNDWNNPKKDAVVKDIKKDDLKSDDEYIKMIQNMDLDKLYDLKIDTTNGGSDKGLTDKDWDSGLHPIGDINIYLTLSEILARDEINGAAFPVKVSMESLLGTWSNEHMSLGNAPNQIYKSWFTDKGGDTGTFRGPFQFDHSQFDGSSSVLRSTGAMGFTYITKLENSAMADDLRAVYGNAGELHNNNGVTNIFPDKVSRWDNNVKKISYTDYLKNIKSYSPAAQDDSSTNMRGSSQYFSDAAYTTAMEFRMSYQGREWHTFNGGANGSSWFMAPLISKMDGWSVKLGLSPIQKQRMYELECIPFHLSYSSTMQFPDVSDNVSFNSKNFRSFLPLILSGSDVAIDSFANSDVSWGDVLNGTEDWYLGFDVRAKSVSDSIFDPTKSGVARAVKNNKIGATQGSLSTYAENTQYSDFSRQGIIMMSYGLRAINKGIRMKQSIQHVIKHFYDLKGQDGKYTYRVNQEDTDLASGADISVRSDKGNVIANYKGKLWYPVNYSVFNEKIDRSLAYRWGPLLTREYNYGLRSTDFHRGCDMWPFPDHKFDQPVSAVADGYVYKFQSKYQGDGSYGNTLLMKCEINGVVAYFRYAHMKDYDADLFKMYNIKPYSEIQGTYVKKGQNLGLMGTTGQSSGVHLHFEVSTESSMVYKDGRDGRFDILSLFDVAPDNPSGVK